MELSNSLDIIGLIVDIVDILVNLLGLLVAIVAILFAFYTYERQKQTAVTLDLSNRFQSWKLAMLADCNLKDDESKKKYIQLYFDLCAEEFRLHTNCCLTSKIKEKDWTYFKEGMENEIMSSPVYKEVWKEMPSAYYTDVKFVNFVNKVINQTSKE